MISFEVKNRFSGKVQFVAEIDCDESRFHGFKLGLAVVWAIRIGANLRGANLRDADLRDADLRGVDLRGVDLRGANLRDADLRGANLRDADLRDANLRDANLRDANLRGAYLSRADLGDLRIVRGPVRQDGYQYILYTSALGGCVIEAGCRAWIGEDAIEQARAHCLQNTDAKNRPQALRIVDYLERELRAIRALDSFKSKELA